MRQSDEIQTGVAAPAPPRLGVYVHFPYCLAKCPYCDFVSYATERDGIDHAGYADAVVAELEARAPDVAGRRLASVFFGGGTPSLWDPRQLGRVLAAVRERLDAGVSDVEVTVECNPTSLDADRARALVDVGVNRLSVGVQSLDAARLRTLGRLHDVDGAKEAVRGALASGAARVSADLIFGLPDESPEAARAEAVELSDLGLSHLSCYQLTIEPGTRFGELARARPAAPRRRRSAVAESFRSPSDEALSARGLQSTTRSRDSRAAPPRGAAQPRVLEGRGVPRARLRRLRLRPRPGRRRGRTVPEPPLPRAVRRGMEQDHGQGRQGSAEADAHSREAVDEAAHARERIMLGLRVAEGVDMRGAWTPERERTAAVLEGRGRLQRAGDWLSIPKAAWLWADAHGGAPFLIAFETVECRPGRRATCG